MMKANKPPKFKPTKEDTKQMEEVYNHFMQIALDNGISEKTMSDIILGLVRRMFKERHDKNWYKAMMPK